MYFPIQSDNQWNSNEFWPTSGSRFNALLVVNKHEQRVSVFVGVLNQLIDYNFSSLVNEKTTRDIINDYFMAPMSLKVIKGRGTTYNLGLDCC